MKKKKERAKKIHVNKYESMATNGKLGYAETKKYIKMVSQLKAEGSKAIFPPVQAAKRADYEELRAYIAT